jgi:endonuclease/exonuclease/phosphatase family metal-dependent hydrolase
MTRGIHPDCEILIMGDLNMTREQIEDHRHRVTKVIKTMQVLQPQTDIMRNGSRREKKIDYIIYSRQESRLPTIVANALKLSDHAPVIAEYSCPTKIPKFRVPNKSFDLRVTTELIRKVGECSDGEDNLR